MRQLTCTYPGKIEWQDVLEPEFKSDNDALVRPLVVARCEIDLPLISGDSFPSLLANSYSFKLTISSENYVFLSSATQISVCNLWSNICTVNQLTILKKVSILTPMEYSLRNANCMWRGACKSVGTGHGFKYIVQDAA